MSCSDSELTYEDAVADEWLGGQDAHAHYDEGRAEVRDQLPESRVADLACLLELRSALRVSEAVGEIRWGGGKKA